MQDKCPICGEPECRRVVAGPGVILISPHPWTHVEPSEMTFLGMPVYVLDDEDGPGEKAADYGAPCTEQDHRCMHVDETSLRNFKPCDSCPYSERFALRRAEIAKATG